MWCLVSGGGDNGAQREETKAQLTPFSPSCVWLSLGIVRPSAALQSTHLEKETNPILPAGIKPLTPLFSPLVFLYFCLLSVGIFQAPSLLFSMKENWWMCVCVCVCVRACVRACVREPESTAVVITSPTWFLVIYPGQSDFGLSVIPLITEAQSVCLWISESSYPCQSQSLLRRSGTKSSLAPVAIR